MLQLQQVRDTVAGGIEDIHQAHQQRIRATGFIAEERGDAITAKVSAPMISTDSTITE